ncbi:unnamed protein product [Amoebophrya sp. A25]|nr:unnamed protein product [Amoebophrya sp. A25]|eukprot:GSA25T00015795001.1
MHPATSTKDVVNNGDDTKMPNGSSTIGVRDVRSLTAAQAEYQNAYDRVRAEIVSSGVDISKSELKKRIKKQLADEERKAATKLAKERKPQAKDLYLLEPDEADPMSTDSNNGQISKPQFEDESATTTSGGEDDDDGFFSPSSRSNATGSERRLSGCDRHETGMPNRKRNHPDRTASNIKAVHLHPECNGGGSSSSSSSSSSTKTPGKLTETDQNIPVDQDAAFTELLDVHAPLLGKDKYLGGSVGEDGCIYGIPGHAKQVLRIDPETGKTTLIGPSFVGDFKWLRGVLARDGCVYGIPSWGEAVLRINTRHGHEDYNRVELVYLRESDEPDAFIVPIEGPWKWHGGIVAQDGNIYCMPCNSDQVLKIEIQDCGCKPKISLFGDQDLLTKDAAKWYGGQMALDGTMYAIPQNASRVLRICPETETVQLIGPDLGCSGWKWHGGNFSKKDGCIYGIPNNRDTVLRINPYDLEDVAEIGCVPGGQHREDGKYKYLGGVCDDDGQLYCIAGDGDRVLKIEISGATAHAREKNVTTLSEHKFLCPQESPLYKQSAESSAYTVALKLVGEPLQHRCGKRVQNKWQNGFFSPQDRCIYGIPLKAEGVLRINTETEETEVMPIPGAEHIRCGNNKWEGGVFGNDGNIYCMPLICKYVLRISPAKEQHRGVK